MENQVLTVFYLVASICALSHYSETVAGSNVVNVTRRLVGDYYYQYQSDTRSVCSGEDMPTYIVTDGECVNDQVLFNQCPFVLTPSGEPSRPRIALLFVEGSTITMTYHKNESLADATVTVAVLNSTLNERVCQIASLEVYRGSSQAVLISHDGFSLNNNGNIVVMRSSLTYDLTEYVGELYRMNLSCSDGRNGCLFFKVIGTTDIRNAKFGGKVPGTPNRDNTLRYVFGSPLFYSVVGTGSVIVLVILCLIAVCLSLQCKRMYKRDNPFMREPVVSVHLQTGQTARDSVYDDIVLGGDGRPIIGSQTTSARHLMEQERIDGPITLHSLEETEVIIENTMTDMSTQHAEYQFIHDERPQRPTQAYSTLVQVGGRPSFSEDVTIGHGESAYAQLHDV